MADAFLPFPEAGEHRLPASFFGLPGIHVRVLVGPGDPSLLSAEERRRLEAFGSPHRRGDFVRGRTVVRRALAETLAVPPRAVALDVIPHGGLHVPRGPCFSLSHSGGLAAVALSARRVGLDVEKVRAVSDALAARMLAAGETPPDAPHALLHVWTAKEAVLKAEGQGVRAGLRSVALVWQAGQEGRFAARVTVGDRRYRVASRSWADAVWSLAAEETG